MKSSARQCKRRNTSFAVATAALLFISALDSGASTMTDEHTPPTTRRPERTFGFHNFSARCFNTQSCDVIYARRRVTTKSDAVLTPPPGEGDIGDLMGGSQLGIPNFPGPANVAWQSLDGDKHSVEVDFDEIFKNRRIIHRVPENDILDGAQIRDPDIFLVVDDRTISVYMRAHVPLKHEEIPGNRFSKSRWESILAYSRHY